MTNTYKGRAGNPSSLQLWETHNLQIFSVEDAVNICFQQTKA
jgi:hypothetical protein